MKRILVTLALLHIGWLIPSAAVATSGNITATIQVLNADDSVFQSGPTSGSTGFTLSTTTTSGTTLALNILSSSPRFFPSGGTTALSTDTFKIENVSSSNLFRCLKTDGPNSGDPQLLEVKGLKATVTSAGSGKKLKITCTNTSGAYRQLTSTSGSYTAKAILKGEMRNSTSLTSNRNVASACVPLAFFTGGTPTVDVTTLTHPCLKLTLNINNQPVNSVGTSTLLTTSVPCSNTLDISSPLDGIADGPCGPGGTGTWNPAVTAGDQLNTSDQGTVNCGTTCNTIMTVTATVGPLKFQVPQGSTLTAQGEFVKLTSSVSVGIADGGVENPQGAENLEVALASELGTNRWVGFCGNIAPVKVVPLTPLINGTRNSTDANTPLKFQLLRANLTPAPPQGFTMESVGGVEDEVLPSSAQASDDFCYEVYIPPPGGQLKNVTDATLTYTFVTGPALTSYPTLLSLLQKQGVGTPPGTLTYSDCSNGCFTAYLSLRDSKGVFQGRLIVFLGNDAGANFEAQHATGNCCSGDNLVGNTDARVAFQPASTASNPNPPLQCCTTFANAAAPSNFGNLIVSAFVVVLGPPDASSPTQNHRVALTNASFNGAGASCTSTTGSPNSACLQVVDPSSYRSSCDWPLLSGLRMAIFKEVTSAPPVLVKVLDNLSIDTASGCVLKGTVTPGDLSPDPGGNFYDVWVQQDAPSKDNPNDPNEQPKQGTNLPDVGRMEIFATH